MTKNIAKDLEMDYEDDGFCRTYYKNTDKKDRNVYAYQDETCFGRPAFTLYVCSSDGEPICSVKNPQEYALHGGVYSHNHPTHTTNIEKVDERL